MHYVNSFADLLTPDQITEISGLEFMQGILDGTLPHPPIGPTLNYHRDHQGPRIDP